MTRSLVLSSQWILTLIDVVRRGDAFEVEGWPEDAGIDPDGPPTTLHPDLPHCVVIPVRSAAFAGPPGEDDEGRLILRFRRRDAARGPLP